MDQKHHSVFYKQLNTHTLSHAYLLWGGDEAGKESAVQEYAELLLGKEFSKNPNFFELMPDTDSGTISMNAVRAMRVRVFQTPWRSDVPLVFVMRAIERISRDALPVLLKILEEPPPSVLFLATTSNLERLSKPLRSRFSLIRVVRASRLSEDNAECTRLSKLTLKKCWESVPKLLEDGDLEKVLRSAILNKERLMQKAVSSQQKSAQREIHELEQLWHAYQLYQFDPTASKRLIGEYAMAFM